MRIKRFIYMLINSMKKNGFTRAEFLKKCNVFAGMGENCFWQPRYLPPEAKLIRLGDNVVIAAQVRFITHDAIHYMLRNVSKNHKFPIYYGAIEVGNNVFIGSNSTVLPDTKIEDNVIIGAGSLVRGRITEGVWGGVPAKRIGSFEDILQRRKCDNIENNRDEQFQNAWDNFNKRWGK